MRKGGRGRVSKGGWGRRLSERGWRRRVRKVRVEKEGKGGEGGEVSVQDVNNALPETS